MNIKINQYIIQYLKGELNVSLGLIDNLIEGKTIKHCCNTEEGSSGSPILSLKTNRIIGINYGGNNKNFGTLIKYAIEEFEKEKQIKKQIKYKNQINLKYKIEEYKKDKKYDIFGEKFVENNINKIDLIINGEKSKLVSKYKLKKGENNIKIIIKNNLTHLEDMFTGCESLIDITELEYLNTNNVNNFEGMFCGCSSLSDIKALENWNVSNGKNFGYMFDGCRSLSDIKALEKWNVSNGNDFSYMFNKCSSLSDIKALENWNVSKDDFEIMLA